MAFEILMREANGGFNELLLGSVLLGAVVAIIGAAVMGGIWLVLRFGGARQQTVPAAAEQLLQPLQDQEGRWWIPDDETGGWRWWDGSDWHQTQAAPVFAGGAKPQPVPVKKQGGVGSCLTALALFGMSAGLAFGGVTLLALDFIPGYPLQVGTGDRLTILKFGGGGLLILFLGGVLVNGAVRTIATRRVAVSDEMGRSQEQRGCLAVLNGLIRLFFGFGMTVVGMGFTAWIFYTEVLPMLGY